MSSYALSIKTKLFLNWKRWLKVSLRTSFNCRRRLILLDNRACHLCTTRRLHLQLKFHLCLMISPCRRSITFEENWLRWGLQMALQTLRSPTYAKIMKIFTSKIDNWWTRSKALTFSWEMSTTTRTRQRPKLISWHKKEMRRLTCLKTSVSGLQKSLSCLKRNRLSKSIPSKSSVISCMIKPNVSLLNMSRQTGIRRSCKRRRASTTRGSLNSLSRRIIKWRKQIDQQKESSMNSCPALLSTSIDQYLLVMNLANTIMQGKC